MKKLIRIIAFCLSCAIMLCCIGCASSSSGTSQKDRLETTLKASKKNLRTNNKVIASMKWYIENSVIIDQEYTRGMKCCNNLEFADVGCGLIAIYNIGILTGESPSLPDIIYWFEQNEGFYFNGALGVKPESITEYYNTFGKSIKKLKNTDELESSRQGEGYYIICQWDNTNKYVNGAHYYAVDDNGSYLVTHNGIAGSSNAYTDFETLLNAGGRLISAYKIDK